MDYTRRELGRLMFGSLPFATLLPRMAAAGTRPVWSALSATPNSTFAGVTVGMNVPYNFGMRTMPVDEVIARTAQLNVSGVELRSQPIELFMGAPMSVLEPGRDRAAQQKAIEDLRAWRLNAKPAGASAVRKKFGDAGIKIDVVTFHRIHGFPDAQ